MLPMKMRMRANKDFQDTMALIAHSISGTKVASAEMSWHLWHPNIGIHPALLNRQGVGIHPKMDNGPKLLHWNRSGATHSRALWGYPNSQ